MHADNNDDDAKAIAVPRVFYVNSQAKKEKMMVITSFSFYRYVFYQ